VCYVCHGAVACAREVDHIVPVSQQGGEEDTNLAAICNPCHARKTAAEANAANPMARPRKRAEERHPGDLT